MRLELSPEEQDAIVYGLRIRICVIETGTPTCRARDAIAMGQPQLVRALSSDQRALVAQHEALIHKVLSAR